MIRFIISPLLILLFLPAKSQITEKHNLDYKNAKFDVFVTKIDSVMAGQFTIVTNTARLSEQSFFDSVARSNPARFFAITASIVDSACNPLGLYIAARQKINDINTKQGNGNFYLKPNGFIAVDTANNIEIQEAARFQAGAQYKYAMQSGPMLIVNGIINPAFDKDSKNKNMRCGVGIFTANNEKSIVFIKSNEPVSFYQLAQIFYEKFNCANALTLESGGNCSLHLPNDKLSYNNKLTVCRFILISL